LAAVLTIMGCADKKALPDNAGQLGLNGVAAGSTQEFTTTVGDRVFFETDSASLTAAAQTTLAKQAQWLKQYPNYTIQVEGHADERGTREYNLALGGRRATAVRSYLSAQGVPAARITTISYGKERPVAVCDNISCWSQNRRGVTVLR
jgi:peptidoglycan-associated lipoprotein